MQITQLRNATVLLEFQSQGRPVGLLVDPMLAPRGSLPALRYLGRGRQRNPIVELPGGTDALLERVTHALITHCQRGHFDHLDRAGKRFLREAADSGDLHATRCRVPGEARSAGVAGGGAGAPAGGGGRACHADPGCARCRVGGRVQITMAVSRLGRCIRGAEVGLCGVVMGAFRADSRGRSDRLVRGEVELMVNEISVLCLVKAFWRSLTARLAAAKTPP